jgi:hypothetical protein
MNACIEFMVFSRDVCGSILGSRGKDDPLDAKENATATSYQKCERGKRGIDGEEERERPELSAVGRTIGWSIIVPASIVAYRGRDACQILRLWAGELFQCPGKA